MTALYNEIEPYASRWLDNLIAEGHIANGVVDTRSIVDLKASDVFPHKQVHFFAGIGIWSYALRLAGWSDDRPVWTGSCPCQPFSMMGKKNGFKDERHLWPTWFGLIKQCKPAIVFGEQVASKSALDWFDLVSTQLEGEGYSIGSADIAAASVGAHHKRQRLFFVAVANPNATRWYLSLRRKPVTNKVDAVGSGLSPLLRAKVSGIEVLQAWRSPQWSRGSDGIQRAYGSRITTMANGNPEDLAQVRAYGNAIVPQVAAIFIKSVMEVLSVDPSK